MRTSRGTSVTLGDSSRNCSVRLFFSGSAVGVKNGGPLPGALWQYVVAVSNRELTEEVGMTVHTELGRDARDGFISAADSYRAEGRAEGRPGYTSRPLLTSASGLR
jgi:hypothetical protein